MAGINFVASFIKSFPEFMGENLKNQAAMASDDLAANIAATREFVRGCFEKPPTGDRRVAALQAVEQRIEIASEAIARLHEFARTGVAGESAVRLDRVVAKAAALLDADFHSSGKPVNVVISIPELPAVIWYQLGDYISLQENPADGRVTDGLRDFDGERKPSFEAFADL